MRFCNNVPTYSESAKARVGRFDEDSGVNNMFVQGEGEVI